MKLKFAAIVMIASVALSCDTSFGCELLDRMLGRAGCSSCEAPTAPSCGCGGGGLMDKIMSKSAGCGCGGSDMLTYDATMDCGPVGTPCGCEAASVADCGCAAPAAAPVADCGCEAAAPACGGGGCGLFSKLRGSAGSLGGGCGCDAPAPVADCGCAAPAPAPVADCGCEAAAPACGGGGSGLFSKLRGSVGSIGGGCGCDAPAPIADYGCAAPAPAPVADCGCAAPAPAIAPVADCGCEAPAAGGCGLGKGLFSKFLKPSCGTSAPVSDCGCSAAVPAFVPAPVVSPCGCDAPVSGGCGSAGGECGPRGKLSLLDRLRGNRIPRTKEGVVIGACNDGCNPPCPQQPVADCGCGAPVEAAPCNSCGGGEVIYGDAQPYDGGCSTCQGSSEGQIIYGDAAAVAAPVMMDSAGETNVAPVVPADDANSTEGVIESGDASEAVEDAVDAVKEASPVVDPGAFVPSRRTTVGS